MAERLEQPSGGLPRSAQPEIYKTPDPRARSVELDALRGIAVLGVAMAHIALSWLNVWSYLPIPLFRVNALDLIQLFGFFQIPLFFVLSGYLLVWTEEKRRKRRGSYSVLNYVKRRALRLVPAYYVAIAVIVLLGSADPSEP